MKILVCGGRNFDDAHTFADVMRLVRPTGIVHGGATGADRLALLYCQENGIPEHIFVADWKKHGRAAGPIRNREMVRLAAHLGVAACIAFPGGAGTEDCTKQAVAAGLLVLRVETKRKGR